MKRQMAKQMNELAYSLPGGSPRAQAYNIAQKLERMDGTIAQMMLDDHVSQSHALRHCYLLVDAGLAKEEANSNPNLYGKYIFIDGSELG